MLDQAGYAHQLHIKIPGASLFHLSLSSLAKLISCEIFFKSFVKRGENKNERKSLVKKVFYGSCNVKSLDTFYRT